MSFMDDANKLLKPYLGVASAEEVANAFCASVHKDMPTHAPTTPEVQQYGKTMFICGMLEIARDTAALDHSRILTSRLPIDSPTYMHDIIEYGTVDQFEKELIIAYGIGTEAQKQRLRFAFPIFTQVLDARAKWFTDNFAKKGNT